MINALIYYWEGKQEVRSFMIDDMAWFVAKDVCEGLEIKNYRDKIAKLDDDERGSLLVDTLGGPQIMATVNESGLYALIFQSRKAVARRFRKWVTSEVLPAIRRRQQSYDTTGKFLGSIVDVVNERMAAIEDRLIMLEDGKADVSQYCTIQEAQVILRRHYNTIYRHLGDFGAKKIFGRWQLRRDKIESFLKL